MQPATTTLVVVVRSAGRRRINVFHVMIDCSLWDERFHSNVSLLSRAGTSRAHVVYFDNSFHAFALNFADNAECYNKFAFQKKSHNALKCDKDIVTSSG